MNASEKIKRKKKKELAIELDKKMKHLFKTH